MIKRLWVVVTLLACSALAGSNLAQEHDAAHAPPTTGSADAQPVLPAHPTWAGVLVILIIGGLFLPAAVIGPIVRALAPEEEPETHSHDEPPGASQHHGPSGTHDPLGSHH